MPTARLQFSLKGLDILQRQENAILMEHFKSILFHKSEPANKQHIYHTYQFLLIIILFPVKFTVKI